MAARRPDERGLYYTLFTAIRMDMFDAPLVHDFLLTVKGVSFATLEGVSTVKG